MWPALKELFKWAFSPEMPVGWRFITVVICCATIAVLGFLYKDHILYFGPAGSAPQEIQYPIVNRERKSDSLIDRSTGAKNRIEQGFEDIRNNPQVANSPEKNLPLENQSGSQRFANVPSPRPREKRNYYRYYIEEGEGDPELLRKTYECGRDGWPADCYLTTDPERIEEARKRLTKVLR